MSRRSLSSRSEESNSDHFTTMSRRSRKCSLSQNEESNSDHFATSSSTLTFDRPVVTTPIFQFTQFPSSSNDSYDTKTGFGHSRSPKRLKKHIINVNYILKVLHKYSILKIYYLINILFNKLIIDKYIILKIYAINKIYIIK